jgi:hypothetical protein
MFARAQDGAPAATALLLVSGLRLEEEKRSFLQRLE